MLSTRLFGLLIQEIPAAPVSFYTVRFPSLERAEVTAEFRPVPAELFPAELFMDTSGTHLADGFLRP